MSRVRRCLVRSGLGRVVCFNWPKYSLAAGGIVALLSLARGGGPKVGFGATGLVVVLVYGVIASLAATWWVYDGSSMSNWQWVAEELAGAPTWVLVHAGFDESGGMLTTLLGEPTAEVDIGPPVGFEAGSLRRARHLLGASGRHLSDGRVPLPASSVDAVVCLFAVHEVRNAKLESAIFAEFARCLRPAGKLLLVEHTRDLANFMVFGPATLHFASARRWKRAILASGLCIASDQRQALFVHSLVGQR